MRVGFHPTHPISSVKVVLAKTFPGADVQAILVYGVKTFHPAARHAGAARQEWESGVIKYALNQGAQGVHGQPSIPGVTPPATSKSPKTP